MNKWEKFKGRIQRQDEANTNTQGDYCMGWRDAFTFVKELIAELDLDSELDGDELEDRLKSPNSPVNRLRTSVSWLEADVGELMGARDALWTELRKLERIVTDAQHQAIEQIQVRLDELNRLHTDTAVKLEVRLKGLERRFGEHLHSVPCYDNKTSKPVEE